MPGRATRSDSVRGTAPPCRVCISLAAPITALALLRKNGMEEISFVKFAGLTCAKSLGVLYFLNSVAVSLFTALSVHCAERMTATTNWYGVLYSSSLFGSGYAFFK